MRVGLNQVAALQVMVGERLKSDGLAMVFPPDAQQPFLLYRVAGLVRGIPEPVQLF